MMGIVGFYCPKCKEEMALSGGFWFCMNPECIADNVKITIISTKKDSHFLYQEPVEKVCPYGKVPQSKAGTTEYCLKECRATLKSPCDWKFEY